MTTPAHGDSPPDAPVLDVVDLVRDYTLPRHRLFARRPLLRALHGVSFSLAAGRSLGIVGESGSGKSTLARTVLALERPTAGSVHLLGRDLFALPPATLRAMRRHAQIVFQDPYGSLDPRQRVGRIVAEPLATLGREIGAAARRERVAEVLDAVGLSDDATGKFPHQFSGGQRQRIAIARALVARPDLIVADEPVSALDVSVQAQVLNLMAELQQRFGLAYLFISHDLGVVRAVTDDIAVMLLGRIVEQGPTAALFAAPRHPYTRALLAAMPLAVPGRRRRSAATAPGAGPARAADTAEPATGGCAYAPRCPLAEPRCRRDTPPLRPLADHHHHVACHLA